MDPYVKIIGSMQRQGKKFNPPSICTGTVTSPPPNLIIEANNTTLYSDDILISDFLLADYPREVNINSLDQEMKTKDTCLNKDDIVAIMPTIDMQTWIVLCKVVSV